MEHALFKLDSASSPAPSRASSAWTATNGCRMAARRRRRRRKKKTTEIIIAIIIIISIIIATIIISTIITTTVKSTTEVEEHALKMSVAYDDGGTDNAYLDKWRNLQRTWEVWKSAEGHKLRFLCFICGRPLKTPPFFLM